MQVNISSKIKRVDNECSKRGKTEWKLTVQTLLNRTYETG